jgi:hypothetical protein
MLYGSVGHTGDGAIGLNRSGYDCVGFHRRAISGIAPYEKRHVAPKLTGTADKYVGIAAERRLSPCEHDCAARVCRVFIPLGIDKLTTLVGGDDLRSRVNRANPPDGAPVPKAALHARKYNSDQDANRTAHRAGFSTIE